METVYDYNMTEEENRQFVGTTVHSKEEYEKVFDQDFAYSQLRKLFEGRGNLTKAREFVKRIKNVEYRDSLLGINKVY
jgi:hypothetical protein